MVNSNSTRYAKVVVVVAVAIDGNKKPPRHPHIGLNDLVLVTSSSDPIDSNAVHLGVVQGISKYLPIL